MLDLIDDTARSLLLICLRASDHMYGVNGHPSEVKQNKKLSASHLVEWAMRAFSSWSSPGAYYCEGYPHYCYLYFSMIILSSVKGIMVPF